MLKDEMSYQFNYVVYQASHSSNSENFISNDECDLSSSDQINYMCYDDSFSSDTRLNGVVQDLVDCTSGFTYTSLDLSSSEKEIHNFGDLESSSDFSDSISGVKDAILDMDGDMLAYLIGDTINEYGSSEFISKILEEKYDSLGSVIKQLLLKKWRSLSRKVTKYHEKLSLSSDNKAPEKYLEFLWSEKFFMSEGLDYARLNNSFKDASEKLGKVIILEKNLPNFKKSIKPSLSLGGIAGGMKFVVYGILFKFAQDTRVGNRWLYGGNNPDDMAAGKSLSNDLKALRSLMLHKKTLPETLHFPIMTVITYLGYSLCAISLLPLGKEGLVYGTNDGGRSYYDETLYDKTLDNIITKLADLFHFAGHSVSDMMGENHEIYLAADVEIHKEDDRYFILDLGRFFPPNNPKKPFVECFRPEYLVNLPDNQRISCDVFSGFGRPNADYHNNAALEAIRTYKSYIKEQTLLIKMNLFVPHHLKTDLHERGINIRHLGFVRKCYLENRDHLEKRIEATPVVGFGANAGALASSEQRIKSKKRKPSKGKSFLRRSFKKSPRRRKSDEKTDFSAQADNDAIQYLDTMIDYTLMEMILRSLKTIYQRQLRNKVDQQVVTDLDDIEKLTYKFHSSIIDLHNETWSSKNLFSTIEQKFGRLTDKNSVGISTGNVLSLIQNKNNILKLVSLVPEYCRYVGGLFLFETETQLYTKSSIPNIDTSYVISMVLGSQDADLSFYWNKFKGDRPKVILPLAIAASQRLENNTEMLDVIKTSKISGKHKDLSQYLIENCHIRVFCSTVEIRKDRPILKFLLEEITDIHIKCTFNDIPFLIRLENLTSLNLRASYTLSDQNLEDIAVIKNLTALNLHSCINVTNLGVAALSLLKLKYLCLSHCNMLTDDVPLGFKKYLSSLDLSHCSMISEKTILLVSKMKHMKELKLSHCLGINDICLSYLTKLKKLETLKLSKCMNVTEEGLFVLSRFTSLTYLDLSFTLFENFDCIEGLSLVKLHLSYCRNIDDINSISLLNVDSLQELELKGCKRLKVASLENLTLLINLKCLDIAHVQFDQELSLDFAQNLRLVSLNVSGTNISNNGFKNLNKNNITTLNLANCRSVDETTIKDIILMGNLKNLDISSCYNIEAVDMQALSALKSLEIINLSGLDLGANPQYFSNWTNLQSVNLTLCKNMTSHPLSQNYIKSPFIHTLYTCTSSVSDKELNNLELKKLTFGHLKKFNISSQRTLRDFLSNNSYMSTLILDYSDSLDDNGLELIGELPFISYLSLIHCGRISDEGLNQLQTLKCLTRLNVNENKRVSCPDLTPLNNLEILNVSATAVSDTFFEKISEMKSLRSLSLNECKITDNAVQYLTNLENLTVLTFAYCGKISDKSIMILSHMVHLRRIDLSFTNVTDKCMVYLEKLNLEHLEISASELTDKGFKRLEHFTNLTSLDLSINKKLRSSVVVLSKLTNLRILLLNSCYYLPLESLGFLSELPNLTELDISDTDTIDEMDLVKLLQRNPFLTLTNEKDFDSKLFS